MSTEYKTMSLAEFLQLKKERPSFYIKCEKTKKDLGHGVIMTWHFGPSGTYFAVINQTVYCFDSHAEGQSFWNRTSAPPPGTVKLFYKVSYDYVSCPWDLNYTLLTYDFFYSCKLERSDAKVISENILCDGRVSVLYTVFKYTRGETPNEYFLVIGSLVISCHRMEPLKRFEHTINCGLATFWRPELLGTMDYVPKYNISEFDERRHKKYVEKDFLLKTFSLSGDIIATMYRPKNKSRHYLRLLSKIYSFSCAHDCELIVSKLMNNKFSEEPVITEKEKGLLRESIEIDGARLTSISFLK